MLHFVHHRLHDTLVSFQPTKMNISRCTNLQMYAMMRKFKYILRILEKISHFHFFPDYLQNETSKNIIVKCKNIWTKKKIIWNSLINFLKSSVFGRTKKNLIWKRRLHCHPNLKEIWRFLYYFPYLRFAKLWFKKKCRVYCIYLIPSLWFSYRPINCYSYAYHIYTHKTSIIYL